MIEKQTPLKTKEVFRTDKGTNVIYDGSYLSEKAFIIEHTPTGQIGIIDHNDRVLNSIIGRIKRTKALVCDHKATGDILKFHRDGRERSISLRLYVYAKYKDIPLKEVRGKNIMLDDDTCVKDGIQDLRSCNLFDAGEIRPYTKARAIEIVNVCGQAYIRITIHGKPDGKPEYAEYSQELYEMLARPSYCGIGFSSDSERGIAVVHYGHGRKCYKVVNLGRFILLYYEHFGRYKNMTGSVKRFISDFPKLNARHKDEVAAHVNSCNWLHTRNNILFMENTEGKNPNGEMGAWIKWFDAGYDVFSVVNDKDEILMSVNTPFRDVPVYIKFKSPQGYADFQLMFQGRGGYRSYVELITPCVAYSTPAALIRDKVINQKTADENELSVEDWNRHKDEQLSVKDNQYIIWEDHSPWYVLTMIANGGEQPGLAWILKSGEDSKKRKGQ